MSKIRIQTGKELQEFAVESGRKGKMLWLLFQPQTYKMKCWHETKSIILASWENAAQNNNKMIMILIQKRMDNIFIRQEAASAGMWKAGILVQS